MRDECWDLLRCTIKMKCIDSLLSLAPLDDAVCGVPCQIRCTRALPSWIIKSVAEVSCTVSCLVLGL